MTSEIETIKKLLANGDTTLAISNLIDFLNVNNKTLLNSALLVQSRLSEYQNRSKIQGTISSSESIILLNQINLSILELIENYEQKVNLSLEVSTYKSRREYNRYLILFLIIAIIGLTYYLSLIFTENNKYKKELAKREEYIKVVELESEEIISIAQNIQNDFPTVANFILEYKQLDSLRVQAIKNGDLFLKYEIAQKMHGLLEKNGLLKINDDRIDYLSKKTQTVAFHSNPPEVLFPVFLIMIILLLFLKKRHKH